MYVLWRAAESRNSGLNSEESFPRQWNKTIPSIARQCLAKNVPGTTALVSRV
jgi:hypothetical protein